MNKKDFFSQAATIILVLCAVIITILVVRKELFPPAPIPNERTVENWQEIDFSGSRYNSEKEKVQIIKFYDYECPYCKQVQPAVEAVREKYSGKVSIQYAHFPLLAIHPYARQAAIAAECARKQHLFEPYHALLFARQEQLGTISYVRLAEETGIEDIPLFTSCLENEETVPIIEAGTDLANELNVSSIPTFLINGTLVSGTLSEKRLSGYIEEALAICEGASCE